MELRLMAESMNEDDNSEGMAKHLTLGHINESNEQRDNRLGKAKCGQDRK
jgi:hypothetical protein